MTDNIHIVSATDGNGLRRYADLVLARPDDIIFWLEDNTGDVISSRVMLCRMGDDLRKRLEQDGMLDESSEIAKAAASLLGIDPATAVQLLKKGEADAPTDLVVADFMGKLCNYTPNALIAQKGLGLLMDGLIGLLDLLKVPDSWWLPPKDRQGRAPAPRITPDVLQKELKGLGTTMAARIEQEQKRDAGNSTINTVYRALLRPATDSLADAQAWLTGLPEQMEERFDLRQSIENAYDCGTWNGFIEGVKGLPMLLKQVFAAGDFMTDLKHRWPPFTESLDRLLQAFAAFRFSDFAKELGAKFRAFLQSLSDELDEGLDEEQACRIAYFVGNLKGQLTEFVVELTLTDGGASVVKFFEKLGEAGTRMAELFSKVLRGIMNLSLEGLKKGAVSGLDLLAAFLLAFKDKIGEVVAYILQEIKFFFKIGLSPETEALFRELGIVYQPSRLKSAGLAGIGGGLAKEIERGGYIYQGEKIATNKKEAEAIAKQLEGMPAESRAKYLEELANLKRVTRTLDDYLSFRSELSKLDAAALLKEFQRVIEVRSFSIGAIKDFYYEIGAKYPRLIKEAGQNFNFATFETQFISKGKVIRRIKELAHSGKEKLYQNFLDTITDEKFLRGLKDIRQTPRYNDSEVKFIFNFLTKHLNNKAATFFMPVLPASGN